MKFLNWLFSLNNPEENTLTEDQIQQIQRDVQKDLRFYDADIRKANFRVVEKSKKDED